MTDAYDIYQEVSSKINKEENGYMPADLFNRFGRDANRTVFNDYVTRLQNPQTAAAEKMKLEDRLSPFDTRAVQVATQGLFATPADCAYFRSAKIKGDGGTSVVEIYAINALLCESEEDPTINVAELERRLDELASQGSLVAVQLMDHDQISKRLNSYVPGKKPTLKKPVMERAIVIDPLTNKSRQGFQVYPTDNLSVFFNYYRRPALPLLVMTPNSVGDLVYNQPLSKGFEFEEEAMTDVVTRIVTSFATYIREGGLFQMAQAEAKP